ncbi:MAG: twin-arginine translocase subunit TatC [Calditrichia bacterium]
MKLNDKEMPFLEHLEEFRSRIIRAVLALVAGAAICLIFSKLILNFLLWPTTQVDLPMDIQVLKVQGMFIVTLQVAFFGGLVLSLPFILYQIWMFVAPGLYPHERRHVPRIILSATALFLLGVFFAHYIIMPFALDFFLGLAPPSISTNIAIDFYIGFIIRLLLVFGLIFQLPILSFFLSQMGILSPGLMKKYRRHAIVVIFILAALFTPPDPFTQIMLAIPLVLLYEISVLIARWVFASKRKKLLEQETPADSEE